MMVSTIQFDARMQGAVATTQALASAVRGLATGQYGEVERLCLDLLAREPSQPDALHYLSLAAERMQQPARGEELIRRAIALRPLDGEMHTNLSVMLGNQHRVEEALVCAMEGARLAPNLATSHNQCGRLLGRLGRFEEAARHLRRALELQPNFPEARLNLALCLLTLGDFIGGFAENETRLSRSQFPLPEWRGEDLQGRTLLLIAEQGYGEIIHFMRYVERVEQMGGQVILWTVPELDSLCRRALPRSHVIDHFTSSVRADVFYPLLSLPFLFRTTLETIPARIPYVWADPAKVARWREWLPRGRQPKIGLVWAGAPTHGHDCDRSISLATLAPLLALEGCEFHSLQKGPAAGQVAGTVVSDHSARLTDFDETAALIENLDLVITVDTAVAHLAGAMGKVTWIMLQCGSDYRWLQHRSDSPWYPTVTLFRQTQLGRWDDVVQQIAARLTGWVKREVYDTAPR